MRAAAILGLGCSPKNVEPFQTDSAVEWRMGLPGAADETDVILIFGGDGTIHRHLGQFVKLGLPVLVVPTGSGNDFANSLGLRGMRESLAAWHRFTARSTNVRVIDLGVIKTVGEAKTNSAAQYNRYFCCVAGVGIDGEVARRANGLPRWLRGNGGYVLSMLPTIFSFAPFRMKVSTADAGNQWAVQSDQSTLLAAFANTPLYGGGMKVAPRARMDDGLLDVCLVSAVRPLRLFRLFPTVYSGQHLKVREVDYFQTSCARVETELPMDVYADGEFVCRTPIEIGIERAAMKVITTDV
jgi:diacylglycerol kinase (ATP)